MNIKIFSYILMTLMISKISFAQQPVNDLEVKVVFKFNSEQLDLNKNYISKKDTLSISTCKMYLTNFKIFLKDKSVYKEENSYHLIDIEDPESMKITFKNLKNTEISQINFNIGVDSTASVSGALDGDLDATKGMYWAWQSGFINMKIEGNSKSCNTRKNAFHFHVGGYLKPYYAMREIAIPIENLSIENHTLKLNINLDQLFSEIDLRETNSIMIPGKEAMKIADYSAKMFQIE